MLADGVRRGLFDAPADADHVSYAPEMLTKRLIVSSLAPSVVNA
jgi:predicted cobalt transporter CbtA